MTTRKLLSIALASVAAGGAVSVCGAQVPCRKVDPCTPEQARAFQREVAERRAIQMNAVFAFAKSLDPAFSRAMNEPVVSLGDNGATGHGFRPQDLTDRQMKAFVPMLNALDLGGQDGKQMAWTEAAAIKQLDMVHVRFCAVVSVEDAQAKSESGVISLFDYGSGAVLPYRTPGKPDAAITGRLGIQKPDRLEYLRRASVLLKRHSYPFDAPIPESAFLREVRVPWSSLSSAQQDWVKRSVTAQMDLGEKFRWERAQVWLWRSVTFTGGYHPAPGGSSGFQNSLL
ncbi:MAG: hypothetical protein H8F28_07340 [Fibrella sp.]|nr:hypothetical protein [Armatimonadota bacterium]